jgi:c-di-GMP-binding flagellar brake protein YcgR
VDQDRRQFYRIDHPVVLDYQVVEEADVARSSQPYQFNVSPYFLLQSQLAEIDSECQHLIYKIAESTPHLATYLQHLNKKIDLIGRTLTGSNLDHEPGREQIINLSEGGLSFLNDSALDADAPLAIKLIFPENGVGLLLYARVQRCEPVATEYEIGISFLKMPESCRTLLARLILEAQARERQAQLS